MTQRTAIVIPAHGGGALTRRCLDTILDQPECRDGTLVVVDDGSRDEIASNWPPELRERVQLVTRERRGGFARACNAGAQEAIAAGADLLVFLNNDTTPHAGWLRHLRDAAATWGRAAAFGSRLLYPDGSTQHAGVVFCQDRFPRHLYAGFPGDHPAVARSRRVRAVSAACMLVRRSAFEEVGGFDEEYENGLEDVDLCLRLGEAGYEVRYCADSVVTHLEMATRSLGSLEVRAGEKRYLRTWGDRSEPDDVQHYVADGLLRLRYEQAYPLRLHVSPWLAAIDDDEREAEANHLLIARSRQAFDLMREVVRLSVVRSGEGVALDLADGAPDRGYRSAEGATLGELRARLAEAHAELRRRDDHLVRLLYELQRVQAESVGEAEAPRVPAPAPTLGYPEVRRNLRALIVASVPDDAVVAVVSKGDDELLELGSREAWHFPRDHAGEYTGIYPETSREAVAHVAEVRSCGASYFAFPVTSVWWLDHYRGLRDYLETHGVRVADDPDAGVIYRLASGDAKPPRAPAVESGSIS